MTSFSELHFLPVSRRPSTSSLPAALLLEKQMTPSSSIDQHLSNFGSTTSLDIVGQSTSVHTAISQNESGLSDAVIRSLDEAILEAGPPSSFATEKGDSETTEAGKTDASELKQKAKTVPMPHVGKRVATPGATETTEPGPRGRVHSSPDDHPRLRSPTSSYNVAAAHNRKDVHSYPSGHMVEHQPRQVVRLPQMVPRHTVSNWPVPVSHMGMVPPHNPTGPVMGTVPIMRGRFQHSMVPYAISNGPMPQLQAQPQPNVGQHGYQVNPAMGAGGVMIASPRNHGPPTYFCYNCGAAGHQGSTCPLTMYGNRGEWAYQ